jgi:hypothetical protein
MGESAGRSTRSTYFDIHPLVSRKKIDQGTNSLGLFFKLSESALARANDDSRATILPSCLRLERCSELNPFAKLLV